MSLALKDVSMTPEQIDLLKRTICKGATNEEFALFLYICNSRKLDPFMKQIWMVPRKAKNAAGAWVETMQPMVAIDGSRLIAERTGCYAPGKETTYVYDNQGKIFSATAYVKKMSKDGTWHEVSTTAMYAEYAQTKSTGEITGMWVSKPHVMLSKCAENMALRKAFPADLSGLYIEEEIEVKAIDTSKEKASDEDLVKYEKLLDQVPHLAGAIDSHLTSQKVFDIKDMTAELCSQMIKRMEKELAKEKPKQVEMIL